MSLRNVFDTYLANAFSMKSTEHIHFPDIVDGMKRRWIDEELYRVKEIARKTCAMYIGSANHKQKRTRFDVLATTVAPVIA